MVPWHPTEILEQAEPLPVVSVIYILILGAVAPIRVLSGALLRLVLIYEARLKIRIGNKQGYIAIALCLPTLSL